MVLDPATLGAVFVLLSAVLGALLLFAWTLNRKVRALAWWGGAFGLVPFGMGMVSLGQGAPGYWVLLIANAIMALAYGVQYAGCRAFNGRMGTVPASIAGAAVWVLAFPMIHDRPAARLALMSGIAGGYAALSAWELWRHAPQRLASQRVAIVLLVCLAGFNFARGTLGFSLSSIAWIDAFASRWSSEMALLLVIYVPALAFIFLSMAKERVEFDYKRAALIDPLTGIPNRRAFLKNASKLLDRLGGKPASCLLFDLDNFKSLNDTYGHDVGDRILSVFGQTLARHLPRRTFGRIGGEEFGAIIPVEPHEAAALAETIRRAFAASGESALGVRAEVSVSVGCATAVAATAQELLSRADIALYQAKADGRNMVVTAEPGGPVDRRALRNG
jgi:diguanylate cyclase (GGDEF)-like protein